MLIKFINKQPILEIDTVGFGINRDKNPDSDWAEIRKTKLEHYKIDEIDISLTMNLEYKLILLEDLAYVYGKDSLKFRNKLIEFQLI